MATKFRSLEPNEKEIENSILDYLTLRGIFAFKIERTGIFDPRIGGFRAKGRRWKKGVSDIVGIFQKRPFAIEVKSKKGKLSPDQNNFIMEWRQNGGFAWVARSVEDVEHGLRTMDESIKKGI